MAAPNNNKVDLLVKGDNALGSQYQPVDLGDSFDLRAQWLDGYTRMVWIRPGILSATTDVLTWMNATAIAVTLIPTLPWVLLPLIVLVLMLTAGSCLMAGLPKTLSLIRLACLVATTIIVLT